MALPRTADVWAPLGTRALGHLFGFLANNEQGALLAERLGHARVVGGW
jgi:hypothetical protein